ncbi:MAG: hypothetical protein HY077_07195 [Elusimicrobia bacterium]|nr:hypothetical protein [Elusimicrobiota bacterium]
MRVAHGEGLLRVDLAPEQPPGEMAVEVERLSKLERRELERCVGRSVVAS